VSGWRKRPSSVGQSRFTDGWGWCICTNIIANRPKRKTG